MISNHINAGGGDGAEEIYALRNKDDFSELINQKKFLYGIGHQLNSESFQNLGVLLKVCLGTNINDNKCLRLLVKSLFYYFELINGNEYYLYQTLKIEESCIQIWNDEKFWIDFYNQELNETKELNLLKEDIQQKVYENIKKKYQKYSALFLCNDFNFF